MLLIIIALVEIHPESGIFKGRRPFCSRHPGSPVDLVQLDGRHIMNRLIAHTDDRRLSFADLHGMHLGIQNISLRRLFLLHIIGTRLKLHGIGPPSGIRDQCRLKLCTRSVLIYAILGAAQGIAGVILRNLRIRRFLHQSCESFGRLFRHFWNIRNIRLFRNLAECKMCQRLRSTIQISSPPTHVFTHIRRNFADGIRIYLVLQLKVKIRAVHMDIAAVPAERTVEVPPDQTLRRQVLLVLRQLVMLVSIFDIQRARRDVRLLDPILQQIHCSDITAGKIRKRIQTEGSFPVYSQHPLAIRLDLFAVVVIYPDPPDLGTKLA